MPVTKADVEKRIANTQALVAKHDYKSVAAEFAPDGKLLRDHGEPVVGPAAIEEYYKQRHAQDPNHDFKLTFTVTDVTDGGDMAVSYGTYVATWKGAEHDTGKWINVVQKQGADFKIKYNMWNSSKPDESHKGHGHA